MPDQRKKTPDAAETLAASYDLHQQAVDDLVSAAPENTPHYSQQELEKYRSGKTKRRFPEWLKVILIKFWFYGAICFFVFWGLGLYVRAQLDLYFAAAIVMGLCTDLLINHFLRFTEKLPGGSRRWIMVRSDGTVALLLNVAYAFLLLGLIITAYHAINTVLNLMGAGTLGVEPLLFGLIATGMDTLCILCRNTFAKIVADARKR